MISFIPIWAIVLRYIRVWKRDFNLILAGFYWSALDILTWGFLGSWIQKNAHFENYEMISLLGVLLWLVAGRGCNIIAFCLCDELWSNNITNLFSLPIIITEWIIGVIIFSAIVISLISIMCISLASLFYNISLPYFISIFCIFAPPLFISSLWLGFSALQIIITSGKRGIELSYVAGWFVLPFVGAYYPINALPLWGQKFSSYLPMSYIFQGMREYVMHNQNPIPYLIKGYVLGSIYALVAIIGFVYCFNRSKQKGLARLVD